ncbi:UDP-4-amino-4,6-dideoxy-N-acetyl-beta-L-altrosamine transaminase [Microvirga sp. M2]|uniref:UDP-4-amino-4, 6-dideoxy-N-acetyl-beta-L-altrosamine transaminase n=1 Tax=Microvirga sp. M2 TaxID=3073270 RepID=UPI0039C38F79
MKIAEESAKSDHRPIPYGRQEVTDSDIEAVAAVLRSDFLTQGALVPRFERAVAERVGAQHAVASNSATSSLHLACLALGVGPGDRVWTSPVTFVASANCARYCGADVDFVDIDPRSYNMSAVALADKLAIAKREGKLPKVVIPVHLAGQPADMETIHALGQKYGFSIIEDASHAIGGRYRDRPVGDCRYSDITVFSFHPVKIITTGEGGMAVTNDPALARRMARLNSHGITRDQAEMTSPSEGGWYYQQLELGYNYRLTELQAALGLSQLHRLDDYVARRHAIAARYDDLLRDLPVVVPWRDPRDYSGFHLYIIRLRLEEISRGHREVFERLRKAGILVNLHYIPVYRQPDFARFGFVRSDFPEAERYYAEAISIPLYPTLTDEQQQEVASAIRRAIT